MTSTCRITLDDVSYTLTTNVGSGRVQVGYADGPLIAMWDPSRAPPWVVTYDGFDAFQRNGQEERLHAHLVEFNRKRTAVDPGLAAVATIRRNLGGLPHPFSEELPRGFAWRPMRLRHELSASMPFEDLGSTLSRVTSRICLVESAQENLEALRLYLAQINRFAVASALHLDEESRCIWSLSSMLVHAETLSWRPDYFSALIQIQSTSAETAVDQLADLVKGVAAVREQPAHDHHVSQSLLTAYSRIPLKDPEHNGFRNPSEFKALEEICPGIGMVSFGAEDTGIAAEMEFGGDTALVQLHADQPHPHFGEGLLFTLQLPLAEEDALDFAAAMNLLEAQRARRGHLQGAWTICDRNGKSVPAYNGFRPAVLYRPGIIQDEFMAIAMRLRYLREALFGDTDAPAQPWRIVLKRLGALH